MGAYFTFHRTWIFFLFVLGHGLIVGKIPVLLFGWNTAQYRTQHILYGSLLARETRENGLPSGYFLFLHLAALEKMTPAILTSANSVLAQPAGSLAY